MGRIGNFFKAVGRGTKTVAAWLTRKLADLQILILSFVIMSAYIFLVYAGVIWHNRLLIILSGIIASLCFCVIVFLALERPSLFKGLITRLGFTLTNGNWSGKDKKRMRGLWFLAVAPLFFTFWLAVIPTKTMGFSTILAALCLLTLGLIGYWQKIPSNFWKVYYNFGKKAFPIAIILVFVVYALFAKFWNSAAKFAVVKSEQAAAWLSSPSKAADRKTEQPPVAEQSSLRGAAKNRKMKIASASRMAAQNKPSLPEKKAAKPASVHQSKTGQRLRRAVAAPAEDDELSRAAEAGLSAFDQMRRELAELHAPKSAQKKIRSASPIKTPKWAE